MRAFLRWTSTAILFAALGVHARTLAIAQPLDRVGTGALTATVVSANKGAVVVRTDDGSLVTFAVDGSSSVPDGLRAGTRVTVRYQLLEEGRYQAVRVGIAALPPEPGSTTAAPSPPPGGPAPTGASTQATPPAPPVPALPETGVEARPLVTTGKERRRAGAVTTTAPAPEAGPADLSSPAAPVRASSPPIAPTTRDFMTLAAAALVAVALLGLALILERR